MWCRWPCSGTKTVLVQPCVWLVEGSACCSERMLFRTPLKISRPSRDHGKAGAAQAQLLVGHFQMRAAQCWPAKKMSRSGGREMEGGMVRESEGDGAADPLLTVSSAAHSLAFAGVCLPCVLPPGTPTSRPPWCCMGGFLPRH